MIIYTAASVRDHSVDADQLSGLTWSGHALWYADAGRERAVCLDPRTGEPGAELACPGLVAGLTNLGGCLLYATATTLRLCEPQSGDILREVASPRTGVPVCGMEAGKDGVWLGWPDALELRHASDLRLLATAPAPLGVAGVTVTDRYVAHTDRLGEAITVFDLQTRRNVLQIQVDGRPATSLTWDGLRLWYADAGNMRLRALDVPGLSIARG
ncbi:hypothetical protein C1I95_29110 [Micromonospora craterilacus]|uniref:Glutamine cyclotransferase n=1 Tax=Micromonospora craterilacus TaxID=1655439 RepID=A0A2W2DG25_9ACTN|nr:hypothetical protein [Micromonospora craterilacus]PZG09391.1 hypothetical protein C1I95_29110 [Micromonospora craterilacus]